MGADSWVYAESLGDAGDDRATATPLPGPGRYYGALPAGDADWYTIPAATDPVCLIGDVRPSRASEFSVGSTAGALVTSAAPAWEKTRLVVAAPAGAMPLTGIAEGDGDLGYAFTLDRTTLAQARSEIGDAGSMPASSQPVPGECFRGHLGSVLGMSDASDMYSIQLDAGDVIIYTLATQGSLPTQLTLVDATGAPVAASVPSGSGAMYTAPSDGTFYLAASGTSPTGEVDYLIGLITSGPPGSPCRPHCFVS